MSKKALKRNSYWFSETNQKKIDVKKSKSEELYN